MTEQTQEKKLSQLMREGFAVSPIQITGFYCDGMEDGGVCAIGAILRTHPQFTPFNGDSGFTEQLDYFPELFQKAEPFVNADLRREISRFYPHEMWMNITLRMVIVTMNDYLNWNIPQIADWLESVGK